MNLNRKMNLVLNAFVVLIVLLDVVKNASSAEYKVIETKNGKVRGIRKTTLIKQIDYYSFKGIPYAKSPTGELRFKATEPVESWAPKELDAFEHGAICMQPITPYENWTMSEDCLFLNIYVPAETKLNEKFAVLIFLHGGMYQFGSGNDNFYGPDFLIDEGVILITINYRLGFLGFASLGSPEYSGNMGLKDQQMALKWIHANIESFSGDNQRITLVGESVGGTSAHLHMLSTESRSFFNNAILMSGSADSFWGIYDKSDHLAMAYKVAEDLGKPKQSTGDLIDFLKTVPPETFRNYESSWVFEIRTFIAELAPVFESKDAVRPFLVESLETLYDQSKIECDAMFSICSDEFVLFYWKIKGGEIRDLKSFDSNFSFVLPFKKAADLSFDSTEYKQIAKEVREFYFKDAPVDENSLKQYMDLFGDLNFAYAAFKSAKRHAAKTSSKSYYFEFSVNSKLNIFMRHTNYAGDWSNSATHLEDLFYLFRAGRAQAIYDEILSTKDDEHSKISLKTIENMAKLFANFAKYGEPSKDGDPTAEFLPFQNGQTNYLDIKNDGLKTSVNPKKEAYDLWERIENKFN